MAIDYNNLLGTAGNISQILASIEAQRASGRQQAGNANQTQDRIALERARLGLDAANSANNYGLNATNQQNQFDLGRSGQDLARSTAQNSFGLGRVNAGVDIGNLDLAQKKFALAAPGARAGNSVRGDILSNAKDVSFAGLPAGINVPTINGGLRPSLFSANTRALGSNMSAQALSDQQKGDTFAPLPTLPDYVGPSSGLPDYKAPPGYVAPPPLPDLTPLPKSNGVDSVLSKGSVAGAIADAIGKSGGGGNLVDLAKSIYNHFHNNNMGDGGTEGTGLPSYDPFEADPETGMPYDPTGINPGQRGAPNDPSGGTGRGPGMQDYYNSGGPDDLLQEYEDWRKTQDGGDGGGGDQWTGDE